MQIAFAECQLTLLMSYRFLLTKLYLESLRKKARYNKRSLRNAVYHLPEKLNSIYEEALQRMNSLDEEDSLLAKQVLIWVMYLPQDLSPRALQQTIASQRKDDLFDEESLIDPIMLISVCCGLIALDSLSRSFA